MAQDDALEEVFRLVSDETRLDIIRALWTNRVESGFLKDEPISFSTLRDHVGVRDSGRFNYHLNQLIPQLVREHEEGYSLTNAGGRIIGAVVSGAYTSVELDREPVELDGCPRDECGGTMSAIYQEGHIDVTCSECPMRSQMPVPPILLEHYGLQEIADGTVPFAFSQLQSILRGFCLLCQGSLERGVSDTSKNRVKIEHECQGCGSLSHTTATQLLIDHPETISMLHEAGIDYRELALWELDHRLDSSETIEHEDPLHIHVELSIDGQQRTALLSEDLETVRWQ